MSYNTLKTKQVKLSTGDIVYVRRFQSRDYAFIGRIPSGLINTQEAEKPTNEMTPTEQVEFIERNKAFYERMLETALTRCLVGKLKIVDKPFEDCAANEICLANLDDEDCAAVLAAVWDASGKGDAANAVTFPTGQGASVNAGLAS